MEILHSHFPSHEERIFERKFRLDGRNDLRSLEVSKRYREKRTRIEKRDPLVSGWKIRKRQSYELKSSRLFLRGTTGKHLDSSMLVASCEKYCRYCARPDSPGRATTVLLAETLLVRPSVFPRRWFAARRLSRGKKKFGINREERLCRFGRFSEAFCASRCLAGPARLSSSSTLSEKLRSKLRSCFDSVSNRTEDQQQ